jgi:hypothetical protein
MKQTPVHKLIEVSRHCIAALEKQGFRGIPNELRDAASQAESYWKLCEEYHAAAGSVIGNSGTCGSGYQIDKRHWERLRLGAMALGQVEQAPTTRVWTTATGVHGSREAAERAVREQIARFWQTGSAIPKLLGRIEKASGFLAYMDAANDAAGSELFYVREMEVK